MKLRCLTRIAVGYVTAACVAACVIVTALLLVSSSQSPIIFNDALGPLVVLAALIAAFAAVLGLVPFLIARAYAERKAITSPTWYVSAGAVVGVIAMGLSLLLSAPRGGISLSDLSNPVLSTLSSVMCVAAEAGGCAGFTYWLIAVQFYRKIPE